MKTYDDPYRVEIPKRMPDLITPHCSDSHIKSICFWFDEGLMYFGGSHATTSASGKVAKKGEGSKKETRFNSPNEVFALLLSCDSLAGRIAREYADREAEKTLLDG